MSNTKKVQRKDTILIFVTIAFITGFVAGAGFAVYKMGPAPDSAPGSPEATTSSEMTQQQTQAITHLEEDVTRDPRNFEAWTRLGNLYFDTGQYAKAVKAYETSLDLHAGNANIWTDLGVMYRRTDRPRKAIEAFDKAIALDPSHQTSRLNKGIVLLYDLDDAEGAIASWEALLDINPEAASGSGQSIRSFVEHLRSELEKQ